MNVFYSLQKRNPNDRRETVLAVGNFDGIHLGHQAMIRKIVQDAEKNSLHSAIVTFINHPAQVIRPDKCPLKITSNEFRIELFQKLGLDELYLLEFSHEFSGQTTLDFLRNLSESLHIRKIIMGHDAAIGKNREGDFAHVQKMGEKLHFAVEEFHAITLNGSIISSTAIRKLIAEGKLKEAGALLGRDYSIFGKVISGEGKGKLLGYPTANLDVTGLCLPPLGVYKVTVHFDGKSHKGVANLGRAPTVRNFGKLSLEVHLLDFQGVLYGKSVEVVFHRFIRPEIKFASVEALIDQIQQDILE